MRATLAASVCLAALVVCSCNTFKPQQTPAMRAAGITRITAAEVRYWTHDLAYRYAITVERAANEIRDQTDVRDLEEVALLWKIRSVSDIQHAAFRSDPAVSFLDLWTLALQQHQFITVGDGAALLGDLQPIAADALEGLLAEFERINLKLSKQEGNEKPGAPSMVMDWAKENPIVAPRYRRQPIIEQVTEFYNIPQSAGGLRAIGSLDERLEVLIERMPFYTEFLPKQAAWQLELTLLQSSEGFRRDSGLAELEHLRRLEGVEQGLANLADLPSRLEAAIEAQSEQLVGDVDDRLDRIIDEIDTMRRETVETSATIVGREIGGAVREVERVASEQRAVAIAEIETMREATIEEIRTERALILAEARLIAADTVDRAMVAAADITSRAMWALTLRIAIVGLIGVVVIVYALRRLTPAPARS